MPRGLHRFKLRERKVLGVRFHELRLMSFTAQHAQAVAFEMPSNGFSSAVVSEYTVVADEFSSACAAARNGAAYRRLS
jgi:hypothetical protein